MERQKVRMREAYSMFQSFAYKRACVGSHTCTQTWQVQKNYIPCSGPEPCTMLQCLYFFSFWARIGPFLVLWPSKARSIWQVDSGMRKECIWVTRSHASQVCHQQRENCSFILSLFNPSFFLTRSFSPSALGHSLDVKSTGPWYRAMSTKLALAWPTVKHSDGRWHRWAKRGRGWGYISLLETLCQNIKNNYIKFSRM